MMRQTSAPSGAPQTLNVPGASGGNRTAMHRSGRDSPPRASSQQAQPARQGRSSADSRSGSPYMNHGSFSTNVGGGPSQSSATYRSGRSSSAGPGPRGNMLPRVRSDSPEDQYEAPRLRNASFDGVTPWTREDRRAQTLGGSVGAAGGVLGGSVGVPGQPGMPLANSSSATFGRNASGASSSRRAISTGMADTLGPPATRQRSVSDAGPMMQQELGGSVGIPGGMVKLGGSVGIPGVGNRPRGMSDGMGRSISPNPNGEGRDQLGRLRDRSASADAYSYVPRMPSKTQEQLLATGNIYSPFDRAQPQSDSAAGAGASAGTPSVSQMDTSWLRLGAMVFVWIYCVISWFC